MRSCLSDRNAQKHCDKDGDCFRHQRKEASFPLVQPGVPDRGCGPGFTNLTREGIEVRVADKIVLDL